MPKLFRNCKNVSVILEVVDNAFLLRVEIMLSDPC